MYNVLQYNNKMLMFMHLFLINIFFSGKCWVSILLDFPHRSATGGGGQPKVPGQRGSLERRRWVKQFKYFDTSLSYYYFVVFFFKPHDQAPQ